MRILEIYVSAFGGVRDQRLELTEGLNTLYRPNGWGKTTLAHFVKAMLYGLSPTRGAESERKKYTPWQGGAFGGTMTFETARGRFRAERFFGARESADTFVLYDLSTHLESDAYSSRLGEELFGIDAEGFLRTVLISGKATRGDCTSIGARLSALVEAADDVGDYDGAAQTIERRIRYYQTTGQRGLIPRLESELIGLERTRDDLLEDYKRLGARREELARAEEEILSSEREETEVRAALRSATVARERAALRAQREALAARHSRIRSRVRALDAAACGKHPSQEAIGRARERLQALHRLERATPTFPEPPSHAPLTVATVILALSALLLAGLGLVNPICLILGILAFAAFGLLGFFRLRARAADRALLRSRDAAIAAHQADFKRAEAALSKTLDAIGAPDGATDETLAAIAARELEYRLLCEELREARLAVETFDATHPDGTGAGASDADMQALSFRERQVEGRLRELRDRRTALMLAIEGLSTRTEALPETEAALVACRTELDEAKKAHETLLCTLRLLREARESLSTRYLDLMRARMRDYLSRLSPDAPLPVLDATLSVSVETDTGTHKASQLSSGWQDLIELCARLSLADALFEGVERPPLILDDPFVNLDDAHLHAGKRLLGELAKRYQILYAVCVADRG